jgi:hypothetical protein
MQKLLRKGVQLAGLSNVVQEKYFISITQDEVTRAILRNDKAKDQSFCFLRLLRGVFPSNSIEELKREVAKTNSSRLPSAPTNDDTVFDSVSLEKEIRTLNQYFDIPPEELLEKMQKEIISTLPSSNVKKYCVDWVGFGKLSKDNGAPPVEWDKYIEKFGCDLISMVCNAILDAYRSPIKDVIITEVLSQREIVIEKLNHEGFERSDILEEIKIYVSEAIYGETRKSFMKQFGTWKDTKKMLKRVTSGAAAAAVEDNEKNDDGDGEGSLSSLDDSWIKEYNDLCDLNEDEESEEEEYKYDEPASVLVLHGISGAGKSWLMCQAVREISHALPVNAVVIYRMLGTTRDSLDALSVIRSVGQQILDCYSNYDQHWNGNFFSIPDDWKTASAWFAGGL